MTGFKITDENIRTELLEHVLDMQVPLTRAFAMKPTSNDVEYMKSKTVMIMDKIIDSVIFAKRHNMPELVDSSVLIGAVSSAKKILNLTEAEAWNKNRTIKPKVYGIFISLLEDFALYIYQLTYVAIGKEYSFGFNDVLIFNELCEDFQFEIAKAELQEARRKEEIDYETYMQKIKALEAEMKTLKAEN